MTTVRTYHHGDLPRTLLDTVEQLIGEVGVSGLSLRETARRAGVSHSAPAHHFGDLRGMLDAFALEGFAMLERAMLDGIARADAMSANDPVMYLREIGAAYLRFAIAHPAHYEVMFRDKQDDGDHGDFMTTEQGKASANLFGPLAVVVGQLVASGVIRPENGRYAASMLWGMVHGIASLWNDNVLPHFYEDHTPDEVVDGIMDTTMQLFEGRWDVD